MDITAYHYSGSQTSLGPGCHKNSFENGSRSPNVPKRRNDTSKLYNEEGLIFRADSLPFFVVCDEPFQMNRNHVTNRKCDLDTETTEQQLRVNNSTSYWTTDNT